MFRWIFCLCVFFSTLFPDTLLIYKIPPVIWQTDKTKALSFRALNAQSTWLQNNPEFSYHLFDDVDIEHYIAENWPREYLDFFYALPIGAMKADLWRYMILATEGGIYADMDTLCLKPIREWPLKGYTSKENILLLDLDTDRGSFCQWSMAATPNNPALRFVCEYILKEWQKKGIRKGRDGKIDVLWTTGPRIFTRALNKYMKLPKKQEAHKTVRQYFRDSKFRKKLNRVGIYFTKDKFFHEKGLKHLYWGSWAHEIVDAL